MAVYFLINPDGKACNQILLDNVDDYIVPDGHSLVLASEAPANLEWVADEVSAPQEIASITRRQFLISAASAGLLTAAEAEAAATSGAIPAAIEAVFNTLPNAQALAARITWATMTKIERGEPLVDAAAAAFGLTPEQVDAFFLSAASI